MSGNKENNAKKLNTKEITPHLKLLKKTLIGENNQFFLVNDKNQELRQHYDPRYYRRFKKENFKKSIISKQKYLENKKIAFNTFIIPDKSVTLRQYLPFTVDRPYRNIDDFKEYLYDLNEIITEEDMLSNDTHIKEESSPKIVSYIASKMYNCPYDELIEKINSKIEFKKYEHKGDLFFNKNWSYKKDDLYYQNEQITANKVILKDKVEKVNLEEIPFEFRYVSKRVSRYFKNPHAIVDKKVLIFHDSTTEKLLNSFIAVFKEVFFYWDHWYFNKKLVDWFKPDDVIEVRTERFIENALTPVIDETFENEYELILDIEKFEIKDSKIHLILKCLNTIKIPQNGHIKLSIDDQSIMEDTIHEGIYTTTINISNYDYGEYTLKIEFIDEFNEIHTIKKSFSYYESFDVEFSKLKSCLKGKENTFFRVNDNTNEIKQHYDPMYNSRINTELFEESVTSKIRYLNNLDICYGLYSIPDKSIVLKDYVPFDYEAKRLVDKLDYIYDLKDFFNVDDFLRNDYIVDMKSTIKVCAFILNKYIPKTISDYENEILSHINISPINHNGSLFTNRAWSYEKDDVHRKYYTIETTKVENNDFVELSEDTIPNEFREFNKKTSSHYRNENSISDKRVLILHDNTINPFVNTLVTCFRECFFYYDFWYFNKELVDWFKPDIVLEIREECSFENPICPVLPSEVKIPIKIDINEIKNKHKEVFFSIECYDLKSLPVTANGKIFIDKNEVTTINILNGEYSCAADTSSLKAGEHLFEIFVEESNVTKENTKKIKFVKNE